MLFKGNNLLSCCLNKKALVTLFSMQIKNINWIITDLICEIILPSLQFVIPLLLISIGLVITSDIKFDPLKKL